MEGILTLGAVLRSLKSSQSTGTFLIWLSVCGSFLLLKGHRDQEEIALCQQLLMPVIRKGSKGCRVPGSLCVSFSAPSHSTPSPMAGCVGRCVTWAQSPGLWRAPCFFKILLAFKFFIIFGQGSPPCHFSPSPTNYNYVAIIFCQAFSLTHTQHTHTHPIDISSRPSS